MNAMQVKIRQALPWVAMIFLVFFLGLAARNGAAEIYSLRALQLMRSWESVGKPPTISEIEEARIQLEIARTLAGADPDNHENVARLGLVQAALPGISKDEKRLLLTSARAEIHSAIALRPTSPYSWTILLLIKRDMNEFDDEFKHALRRAAELGPWEPELLVSLADIGLSAWSGVTAEDQALIQKVFVRGMKREDDLMRGVAQVHRNECARIALESNAQAECQ